MGLLSFLALWSSLDFSFVYFSLLGLLFLGCYLRVWCFLCFGNMIYVLITSGVSHSWIWFCLSFWGVYKQSGTHRVSCSSMPRLYPTCFSWGECPGGERKWITMFIIIFWIQNEWVSLSGINSPTAFVRRASPCSHSFFSWAGVKGRWKGNSIHILN